jgi:hypothetical protein
MKVNITTYSKQPQYDTTTILHAIVSTLLLTLFRDSLYNWQLCSSRFAVS